MSLLSVSWRRISAGVVSLSLVLLAGFSLAGCGGGDSSKSGGSSPTPENPFASVVFIGDSLTAGYQNGSLLDSQQTNGYAALIAAQTKFPITLPLIAPPGLPAAFQLTYQGGLPVISRLPGTTTGRDNPTEQPTDLAVPGHLLHDVLNAVPTTSSATGQQLMTNLVLGYPAGNVRTQLVQAIALKPTTIFVWAGSNDALIADELGTPAVMTSVDSFNVDFTTLLTTLKTQTSAHIFVANVPDVTAVPYMIPASTVIQIGSSMTGAPAASVAALLGIQDGDLVNLDGLQTVIAQISAGTVSKLPDSAVLTPAEAAEVRSTVDSYNQVIAQQVAASGATLVDVHAYIASLSAGITVNGKTATTAFLGGLFGLDGIHPSNTGYALIANQFIAAVNTKLGTSVPAVDVNAVAAKDPLVGLSFSLARPAAQLAIRPTHLPIER